MENNDYKIDSKKLDGDQYHLTNIRKLNDPKMRLGDIVKQINMGWYFESTIEKLILVVLCCLGILRILQWVF